MAFCPQCSFPIDRDAPRCSNCGANFGEGAAWKPLAVPPEDPPTDWTPLRHLGIGLVVAAPLVMLAWGMGFPESPFHQELLAYPRLRGFVEAITLPALFLVIVGTGGGHGGGGETFIGGVFLEGMVLGVLLSIFVPKLARRIRTLIKQP